MYVWCPQRPEEIYRYTESGITDSHELLFGCWELNPGVQKSSKHG